LSNYIKTDFGVLNLTRKLIAFFLTVLILTNITACGTAKLTRYESQFLGVFDTMTTIVGYAHSKEEFTKYSQLIHDKLLEYHKLYDIYNDYEGMNNLKTINDNAGKAPVKVDKRIIDLVEFSKDWYQKTDGKVNIAFGAVLSIWHNYRERGIDDPENAQLPPMDKLKEANKHTDINKVDVNEKDSTIYLEDPEMSLDVGAVAKGYATEMVGRIAEKNGFTSGLISVGGNVRALGSKEGKGQPWNVGIQNPDLSSEQKEIKIVNAIDSSVVTSGIYERYYTVNGKNYHHIIDPNTLFPSLYYKSVSILCKDSGTADALSTSVFNMPFEEGLPFIESLPDTEAMWIFSDGEIKYSDHFTDHVKK